MNQNDITKKMKITARFVDVNSKCHLNVKNNVRCFTQTILKKNEKNPERQLGFSRKKIVPPPLLRISIFLKFTVSS